MNLDKELIINDLDKIFPLPEGIGSLRVLDKISLQLDRGEIIAILGPSGCGKSTLLNILAGFEKPNKGEVYFKGTPVTKPTSQIGMVFQSAVLFPWLTVKGNIAYGLRFKKYKDKEIDTICQQHIHLVGLEGFEKYYPNQLSGGMQQRTALARILALEPKVLLMDEPFASLDAQSRITMQQLLLSIWSQIQPTIIFVTHDVEEALVLADNVYIMSKLPGRITHKIKVPLGRPRPISVIGTAEFSKIKGDILTLLFS
jgi:NitT/TauT family transport system ATP-binding protein